MKNPATDYNNAYSYDNVYGHALALLARFPEADTAGKFHLDVGCGYGRIAEPLTSTLGVSYLGVDADAAGVESLRERGFEAQQLVLSDEETTFQRLTEAIGSRRLHSISLLDTLEHLVQGDAALRAIARIAHLHSAYVVVSTPNVAHADIGRKLAFGQWEYTAEGLLDHTHVRLYSDALFVRALRHAGLHTVDSNDVIRIKSDQHFPATHPALAEGTVLGALLADLRARGDRFGSVNQFVRLCAAGAAVDRPTHVSGTEQQRPFLSVLMRTQGTRLHTLVEALTCLAGQTDDDFEVLVVGHRLDVARQLRVERVLEDSPEWLRAKIRFIRVEDGNRTRPLNVGFEAANGSYIAILDDDDVPFAHWVATFRDLHKQSPGKILRAVAVRQDSRNVEIGSMPGLRGEGGMDLIYPPEFDLFDHMVTNQSPPVGLAFPRGLFHDLHHRFDESLTTTEDWDYLLRGAFVLGVASSPKVTSIYRWWTSNDESSRTVHSQGEWETNYQTILLKTDHQPILLPPGSAKKIRALVAMRGSAPVAPVRSDELRKLLLGHLLSSSWKVSAPLRFLARMVGGKRVRFNYDETDPEVLRQKIRRIRRTVSWKLTKPLRLRKHWWDVEP